MVIGVTWYRPEEYKALMAMFEDGADFPETYEGWLKSATKQLQEMDRQGIRYEKAILGLENFPAFCRKFHQRMDTVGRATFAAYHMHLLEQTGTLHQSSRN